jgi:hypothetical protein
VQRQKLLYHVRKKWPHRTGKVKRNHPRTVKPSREKLKTNGGPLAFDYKGFTTFRYFWGMFEGKNAPAGPRKAKKAKGFYPLFVFDLLNVAKCCLFLFDPAF